MYAIIYTLLYKRACHCIHLYIVCHCIHDMSNTTQYVRKCKDCQAEILMKNLGDRWAALEKDGSTQHRCKGQPQTSTANHKGIVTGGNESKAIEISPTITVQNGHIDVDAMNDDKTIAFEKRLSKLEAFVNSLCESWVMNQP